MKKQTSASNWTGEQVDYNETAKTLEVYGYKFSIVRGDELVEIFDNEGTSQAKALKMDENDWFCTCSARSVDRTAADPIEGIVKILANTI